MIEPNEIYKIVEKECKKKKISQQKLLSDVGLSRNTLDNMKKGSMPSVDKVSAIAEYLGVPIDYLLGTEQDVKSITADIKKRFMQTTREVELYNALVQMSDEDLKKVESYAAFLVAEKEKEPPASSGE